MGIAKVLKSHFEGTKFNDKLPLMISFEAEIRMVNLPNRRKYID